MKKIRILIYDKDVEYTESLLEYVQREMEDTVELSVYSGWPEKGWIKELPQEQEEQSEDRTTCSEADIWLVESSVLADLENDSKLKAELEKEQSKSCLIWLTEGQLPEPWNLEKNILKYQSADAIIRQALYYWQDEQDSQTAWKNVDGEHRIIGVYAPGGHEMQQAFTMILARQLAREAKVLYISLLEYDLLEADHREEWQFDLSDLVCMMQRTSGNFREKLESVVQKNRQINLIPPMENAANIHEITGEQYQSLLSAIVEETDYQVIIVDYGCIQNGFYELFEKSEELYCITGTGAVRECQLRQFQHQAEKFDEKLLEKIHVVKLEHTSLAGMLDGDLLEELEYGSFGDLVRGELYGRSA